MISRRSWPGSAVKPKTKSDTEPCGRSPCDGSVGKRRLLAGVWEKRNPAPRHRFFRIAPYASELARAGQSNRRRAGTGSASSECATRPPLWPAGMAEGNRETFGPRVGLSSHGSPAKGGPKSKCLARLKIARTSAGPPSLTISDPSRFPLLRTRPAFPISDPSRFPLAERQKVLVFGEKQSPAHASVEHVENHPPRRMSPRS